MLASGSAIVPFYPESSPSLRLGNTDIEGLARFNLSDFLLMQEPAEFLFPLPDLTLSENLLFKLP
ncbi:MAG: hypothetical protein ACP5RH_20555, partial [Leptodesmis sp.]